jgi:hypothetical protein
MIASRIALALFVAACLLVTAPSVGMATEATQDTPVSATTRTKLPTAAELAQIKADSEKAATTKAEQPKAQILTTQQQIDAWHANAPKVSSSTNSTEADDEITGPRQVHGEASVSVGTGGYRSVYMSSQYPIGENGTLGIAIGQTDFGKNGGGYYSGGYPGGVYPGGYYGGGYGSYYGNGYGGLSPYGYGRQRGGTSQSIALSLDMSGDKKTRSASTPEGCAPGFRDGDRYIEPLWVTEMRGSRTCETTTTTTTTTIPTR